MKSNSLALVPTALLTILACWSGTFHGAATARGALTSQASVLLFCLLAAPSLFDPLQLGRSGRWLTAAVLLLVGVSWWASPVSRAGLVGLVLLPAYLLIPAATARCWSSPPARRLGLISVPLVTLAVSLMALIRWQTLALARASLPLGHHNLLAAWLVLLLPLSLIGVRSPGYGRWLALAATTFSVVAIGASGSLLGLLAVTVQIWVAAYWWRGLRPWLVPLVPLSLLVAAPRLFSIARGLDSSAIVRESYLAAGWQGLVARPTLGWGPGSVPWTLGQFLQPQAGVHPASEIVGDLHSLPLQLAYELGSTGLLLILAIVGVFISRRWRESKTAGDPSVSKAAILGLIGGGVFALGAAPIAVPALPAATAVIAGVALPSPRSRPRSHGRPLLATYLLLSTALLIPVGRAHLLYDRARLSASRENSLALLDRVRDLDPDFPLYRARQAWLAAEIRGVGSDVAEQALLAAEMAPGLAPLWLAAGDLGNRAGTSWAAAALNEAYRLDPLSPLAAFHLMTLRVGSSQAVALGVESVLGDPRLAGAEWWLGQPELAARVSQATGVEIPNRPHSKSSDPMVLALTLDRIPALSFSLHAFRRSPWPDRLAAIKMAAQ